jgi:thioredoxin 2
MNRGIELFQSSIAIEGGFYRYGSSCSRNQYDSRVKEVRKRDVNNNVYAPNENCATATIELDRKEDFVGVRAEEHLSTLWSKSLKELKLACSRRNIQYGKFSEKEEYVNAIWQDMKKALGFSVTGLVQPGAMTELTEEQLELEMARKDTLIVVDVFARWCGPCRAIVPQLEVAAKKLMESKVRVVKIDADKYPSWATKHQVEGLPAILLIQGGRIVDRMEGTYTATEIFDFAQKHI